MHITRSRPIRRGLLGGLTAVFVLAIGTGVLLGVVVDTSLEAMSERARHVDELATHAADLRASLLDQETGLRGYQLTGDDAFLQPYRHGLRREEGALAALIVDGESDEVRLAARDVGTAAAAWRSEWAQEQLRLVEAGDFAAVRERASSGGGRVLFDRIRGALGRVDLAITDIRNAALESVDQARRATGAVIVGAVAAYGGGLLFGGLWVVRRVERPLAELVATAEALERGEQVKFAARRDDEIGTLARTLEALQATAEQRYEATAALADRAAVMNRLSELMSYADDEDAVIRAGVAALERLVPSRGGEVLLVNPSFDQLRVHSGWGDVAMRGDTLAVDRPTACPGIRRNTVHITRSALDAFSLTCAIHPLRSGSLLCVPMVSHNEVMGVIHIEREEEDGFDEDAVRTAGRAAESVALSMANLRLMQRMERQAMTDPLTGLANARSFDPLVERELAIARREGQPAAIIMLDLDHFKQFNDAHGHPAGDEALRAFSRAVRGTLRETDVASRYGGEEFAILLRNTDLDGAMVVAEKLRSATELTPIEIGPNRFARITASFGVAASDRHGTDRAQLMRLADAALYVAKEGRNRVASAPAEGHERHAREELPTSIRARVQRAREGDATTG